MANVPLARFPAKMDSMAEIRALVESACTNAGIDHEDCLKLLLIVEELFTNTVTHGYGRSRFEIDQVTCERRELQP